MCLHLSYSIQRKMYRCVFSVLFVNFFVSLIFGLDMGLIEEFFNYNALNFGTMISCKSDGSFANSVKHFMSRGIFLSGYYNDFNITRGEFDKTNKHFGIVLDGSCNGTKSLLNTSANNRLFTERHVWLIVDPVAEALETLESLPTCIDSELYLAVRGDNGSQRKWNIFEVYNPSKAHGGSLFINSIGSFENDRLNVELRLSKYWRRRNMTGVRFKSIIVLTRPFAGTLEDYVYDDTKRDVNTLHRFNYILTKHVQELYNFSMKLGISKSWGYLRDNGSFDGMVGALERREIDFGTTPAFYKTERAKVVDYSRATWPLRSSFMFRHPKSYSALYKIYLIPLATPVWLCTLFAVALLILFFRMSTVYEWKFLKDFQDITWGYSVVYVVGIFCQQGIAQSPSWFSGKILTISGLILSFMVYQFYSASIVATLLMDNPITIKTLTDLLQSSLKIGIEDVLYIRSYFNDTKDPATQKLYAQKMVNAKHLENSSDGYYPPEQGLNLMKKGGFAFLVEHPFAYKNIDESFPNDAICELAEIKVIRASPMIPLLQKQSPFREMLNYGLQRLAENGVLHRQRLHWTRKKPACIEKSAKSSIDLIEFSPVLELLAIGMCLSLIIFCGEILYHNVFKLKRFQTTKHIVPYVD